MKILTYTVAEKLGIYNKVNPTWYYILKLQFLILCLFFLSTFFLKMHSDWTVKIQSYDNWVPINILSHILLDIGYTNAVHWSMNSLLVSSLTSQSPLIHNKIPMTLWSCCTDLLKHLPAYFVGTVQWQRQRGTSEASPRHQKYSCPSFCLLCPFPFPW